MLQNSWQSVELLLPLHRRHYVMKQKVNVKTILSGFFAGHSFRQKVENDPNGDLYVIQMKDLEHNYSTISVNLTKIKSEIISNKSFLSKGDVLLITKGANNYAVEYKLDFEKVIAASAFFVLRPDQRKIIPAYLVWYINQTPVQQHLKASMAGTYIPNINKSAIEEIEIELPELNIQEIICRIDFLRKREYLLTEQLLSKREQFISNALLKIVSES